jgi:hypothetical protein
MPRPSAQNAPSRAAMRGSKDHRGFTKKEFPWHLSFVTARANEQSFRTSFEPHRRAITLHCYRMLGSLQDAEESVQETLLRAWQRQDEVRSPDARRAWLYKIATNRVPAQPRDAPRPGDRVASPCSREQRRRARCAQSTASTPESCHLVPWPTAVRGDLCGSSARAGTPGPIKARLRSWASMTMRVIHAAANSRHRR